MKIEGSYTFNASRDVVWPMLLDPAVLANVMPGCDKLEKTGDNEYEGELNIKVGPVQGKFKGTVALSDINEPESYHMEVNGRGPAGIIKGTGRLILAEENGDTVMTYEGDAQVSGRIAQVGQRLIDTSAKAIIRQSLEGLDQQVQARVQPNHGATNASEGEMTQPPPVAAPTQTEFALGVAKNFFEELVPVEQQGEFINKVMMVVGGLILFRIISNWWINRIARKVAQIIKESN
jgi:carbon monoxide dehydrogenase subunit G